MATLLSIGEFSRLTSVSVKALRHYHDLDLLCPCVPRGSIRAAGIGSKGDRQLVFSVGGGWWVGSPSGSGCGLRG